MQSLKQLLKQAKKKKSLPFIMDEEDHILINNFSHFYLRPIYLFKNSNHIFDNEVNISDIITSYKIIDDSQEIKNYSFIDSKNNLFVQASDIFVGLMGKLSNYINTNSREQIIRDFNSLSEKQLNTIDFLIKLIEKSKNKNVAFLNWIDSHEELTKIHLICEMRSF
ncbi:DUF3800 domain-containing protein [Moorena sp. SIOASIH]|uniref:DUF3800 domain-containing protein n=1 Tax=Moorena sp. SIOASIH TaxID=2607817 RepID=UPI0025CB9EC5|nr:DUF3800 domain-containing protein [Moorena sp. SIOASIH]